MKRWAFGFGVSQTLDKGSTLIGILPNIVLVMTENNRGLTFEWLAHSFFIGFVTCEEIDEVEE